MKTVLSVFCCLGVLLLLTSCDNGDSSSGGRGDFEDVSFLVKAPADGGDPFVICYNANNNVITTKQVCTWNCAYYESNNPRKVVLTFDERIICIDTGPPDPVTGVAPQNCELKIALVDESFGACIL